MKLTTRTVDTWRTADGVAIRADVVEEIDFAFGSSHALYLAGAFLPRTARARHTLSANDWPETTPDEAPPLYDEGYLPTDSLHQEG